MLARALLRKIPSGLIYFSVTEVQIFPFSTVSMVAMPETIFSLCHTGFSHTPPFLCEILKGTFS